MLLLMAVIDSWEMIFLLCETCDGPQDTDSTVILSELWADNRSQTALSTTVCWGAGGGAGHGTCAGHLS